MPKMEWIKGSPPQDKEGIYLIWLSKKRLGEHIHTFSVRKVSNGYLIIISGTFVWDMLDDECKVVAYISLNDLKEP
jgi:hypothetical protein